MPKGWGRSSPHSNNIINKENERVSPYSPDRGTLPAGWVYSTSSHGTPPYDTTYTTKNSRTYGTRSTKTSNGSTVGIKVVIVIIIWLIIGALLGSFGDWWYYVIFFILLLVVFRK